MAKFFKIHLWCQLTDCAAFVLQSTETVIHSAEDLNANVI